MALKVNSFSAVLSAGQSLSQAATDYANSLEAIRTLVEETKTIWQGADADQYRTKVNQAIGEGMPLDKVSQELQSHADTLQKTNEVLKKVSSNITQQMG